jgi:hypothetical protein
MVCPSSDPLHHPSSYPSTLPFLRSIWRWRLEPPLYRPTPTKSWRMCQVQRSWGATTPSRTAIEAGGDDRVWEDAAELPELQAITSRRYAHHLLDALCKSQTCSGEPPFFLLLAPTAVTVRSATLLAMWEGQACVAIRPDRCNDARQ